MPRPEFCGLFVIFLYISTHVKVVEPGMLGMGGMGGMGMGMGGLGMGGMGSSSLSKSFFDEGNKKMDDEFFKKMFGNEGMMFNNGISGFGQGGGLMKDIKGSSGFYSGMKGGKKMFEDGKKYQGGKHFGQDGENKGAEKEKKGHKKGYIVKGFKTSHQTDESSNTEDVYDEENDEAAKQAFKGENGKFGDKKDSAVKGEQADAQFSAEKAGKKGEFENKFAEGKEKEEHEKHGQHKQAGDGAVFGVNNGGNLLNNAGHHESNKFYKHYPIHG